ncbi:MAG: hypothetical protein QM610_12755 [Chitinophagaceae bacterium]
MKNNIGQTFDIVIYGAIILIMVKTKMPFLILFSYIILITPALTLLNNMVGNNFNIGFNNQKEEIKISDKSKTVAILILEIIMKILCLSWILVLTWFVFTKKIHLYAFC